MAIARITGQMLQSNLERQGADIAIDGNLIYADVINRRVGINNASPSYSLDSSGNVKLANLIITHNQISSNTGKVSLGSIANVGITGGNPYNTIYTDGSGSLAFGSLSTITSLQGFTANNLLVGTATGSNNGYGTNALTNANQGLGNSIYMDEIMQEETSSITFEDTNGTGHGIDDLECKKSNI